MTGRVTVLTPQIHSEPIELGRTTWRKQVLPVGALNYKGRRLNFTKDYINNLVESFKSRAFDAVPFQLADADNRHTNDPERTAGEVLGLEAADDGLYATVSLSEKGSEIVREHPNLGVSVRIVEQFERGDGKAFPAAVQHVLATWDPRINGMKPWEAIACANETAEVVDLSALTFTPDGQAVTAASADTGGQEIPEQEARAAVPTQLTEEELAACRAVLPLIPKLIGQATEQTDDELDELDDDLDAMTGDDDEPEGADVDERELVAAANDDTNEALELANARIDELMVRNARLEAHEAQRQFEAERDTLVRDFGLPPAVVNLAQPLLHGTGHTVELANGSTVDAGDVVRKVLREMGRIYKAVDMSRPVGSPLDADAQAEAEERDTFLNAVRASGFGN